MERTAWTDERLDDAMTRIDARFDRVETNIRDLRGDVHELRREMHDGFARVHRDMFTGAVVLGAGYLGLVTAVLAAGA